MSLATIAIAIFVILLVIALGYYLLGNGSDEPETPEEKELIDILSASDESDDDDDVFD